jgi:hypothetical protein
MLNLLSTETTFVIFYSDQGNELLLLAFNELPALRQNEHGYVPLRYFMIWCELASGQGRHNTVELIKPLLRLTQEKVVN